MNRKSLIDLDTRVDNCDFGTHETRILNALQTIDVFTLRQLVRCEERQLTNIRFVGKVIIRDSSFGSKKLCYQESETGISSSPDSGTTLGIPIERSAWSLGESVRPWGVQVSSL